MNSITRSELEAALDRGTVTLVDALPEGAYRNRHLPNALNLTAVDAAEHAQTVLPDRTAPIVVYSTDANCTRGVELVDALTGLGYQDVRRYTGGIEDWIAAGLPIVQGGER